MNVTSSPAPSGLSASRPTPPRYIKPLKLPRATELHNSAALPSRNTIMFSGSPLLDKVRSIPRASAITIRKTATVKPIVNAVASVLPFLTTMFRMLYLSGRAMLFSAPQCFSDRQTRDSISRVDHADQSNQNRQHKRGGERFLRRHKGDEVRNVKTQIDRAEDQHLSLIHISEPTRL